MILEQRWRETQAGCITLEVGSLQDTLLIGVAPALLSLILGAVLGAIAGYYSGSMAELILMRLADILTAVPGLLFAGLHPGLPAGS